MTLKFESPAEMEAYPVIHSIALKHKLYFKYQQRFFETKQYACKKHNGEWEERAIGYQDNCYYCKENTYEKYRADFVLERKSEKLVIEIDGEEFHQSWLREDIRDEFLNLQGYEVIHIPANKVNTSFLKTQILTYFGLQEK